MKIKVSKHKLSIHYRGSPRGGRTQHHAYCLRYAHSQHIESHLGKKQQQAKIPIAFLFSQLHFSNITSYALFYGGQEMRSAKLGNHLKRRQDIDYVRFTSSIFMRVLLKQKMSMKPYANEKHFNR